MRMYQRLSLLLAVATILIGISGSVPTHGDAYTVYFESDRDGDIRIYRAGADGPVAVSGPGCQHPSVTADNRMLVYTRIQETLWGRFWNVFYVIDGEEHRLSRNEIYDELEPTISRDGTFASYSSLRAGNLEIITVPMDQNDLQFRITENEKPDESPALGTGEEWVYWTGRTGRHSYVFRAPGRGGPAERISVGGIMWEEGPGISADGRYLVYVARTPENEPEESEEDKSSQAGHKYPGMGGTPIVEEEADDEGDDEEFEDGVAAEDEIVEFEGNSDIWVLDLVTGDRTRLTTDPAWDGNPGISADGTRIVFTSDRDGNYEIYTINRDGSGLTRVTNDAGIDDFAAIT